MAPTESKIPPAPYAGTYALLMAEYNAWMNERMYAACAPLSDAERKRDRGAFFRSIHATLDHIISGDRIWIARFQGMPLPQGPSAIDDFAELRQTRAALDERILAWAREVTPAWLAEPMTWSPVTRSFTQTHPRWVQVAQMYNHQTHHRGQVHAMMTAAGIDMGPTDIPVLPVLMG
jgi:uncharacterized damage-inducible protein DinB